MSEAKDKLLMTIDAARVLQATHVVSNVEMENMSEEDTQKRASSHIFGSLSEFLAGTFACEQTKDSFGTTFAVRLVVMTESQFQELRDAAWAVDGAV